MYNSVMLDLIQEMRFLLEETKGDLLVSSEDAAYFRSFWKPKPEMPQSQTPPPAPAVKIELPTVLEPPKPVLKPDELPPPPPKLPKLEELPASIEPSFDFVQLRTLLKKVAPDIHVLDHPPSDATAKRICQTWKARKELAKITLVSFQEPPEHKLLLEKIAHALDVYFGPARLIAADKIEAKKEWETFLSLPELELIIICDSTLWQLPNLRPLYKERPREHKRFLGEKSVFLLPDLSLYLKDPLLKRSLWKALCQMFVL